MARAWVLALVIVLGCATAGEPPGDEDAPGGADAAAADPDAGPGTAPDGAPPAADAGRLTAAALGDPCTSPAECPPGYACLGVTTGAAVLFCTLPCLGTADMTTCADGYGGKGTPGCFLADNPSAPTVFYCALACGPELPVPTDGQCPANLSCGDLNANGLLDLCVN